MRIFIGTVGSAFIGLALLRCSPLAPSIPKFDAYDTAPTTSVVNLEPVNHTVKLETIVMGGNKFSDALEKFPANTHFVTLNDSQLVEFLESKKVELPADDTRPEFAVAFVELKASPMEIEAFCLNDFKAMIKANSKNSYTLSVPPTVSDELWQDIQMRLVQVTVLLGESKAKAQ